MSCISVKDDCICDQVALAHRHTKHAGVEAGIVVLITGFKKAVRWRPILLFAIAKIASADSTVAFR
jgi:hypothetical protein